MSTRVRGIGNLVGDDVINKVKKHRKNRDDEKLKVKHNQYETEDKSEHKNITKNLIFKFKISQSSP